MVSDPEPPAVAGLVKSQNRVYPSSPISSLKLTCVHVCPAPVIEEIVLDPEPDETIAIATGLPAVTVIELVTVLDAAAIAPLVNRVGAAMVMAQFVSTQMSPVAGDPGAVVPTVIWGVRPST